MNELKHEPVLLEETIKFLDPRPNQNFVDGTVGDGGHASAILELTAPDGRLLGFDRDEGALRRAQHYLSKFGKRIKLVNDNYKNIRQYAAPDFDARGILLDLGYSLVQIKSPERGFSFHEQGPLDMRFDTEQGITAAEIVNTYSEADLARIFLLYGEERYARPIARQIIRQRKKKLIETTLELVGVIEKSVPWKYLHSKLHFATRTFQALRIETNGELEGLEQALPDALSALGNHGRLAVITFHSLEDRIVKQFMRRQARAATVKLITKKPIKPSEREININPRSRSAKLRVCEKIKKQK
ncbi:MAG: 16S rRNA (cytosine(1402)-N(4))-methyltransferase RsmH [Patescibacteria group bacterium]|nr:16S rRNA (cytosine(1402)-N(4))-methyltransferase RsmH [Patescibacteria group bacterium]